MSTTKSPRIPKSPSKEALLQAIGLMSTAKPTMLMRPNDPIGMAEEIVEEMYLLRKEVDRLRKEVDRLSLPENVGTYSQFNSVNTRQKNLEHSKDFENSFCSCGVKRVSFVRFEDHGTIKGLICPFCKNVEDLEYCPSSNLNETLKISQMAADTIKEHEDFDKKPEEGPSECADVVREQRDYLQEQLIRAEEGVKFVKSLFEVASRAAMESSTELRLLSKKHYG